MRFMVFILILVIIKMSNIEIIKNLENIHSDNIVFDEPEKKNKKYLSNITIDKKPLCIQTDKLKCLKIKKTENFLYLYIELNKSLFELIKCIEDQSEVSCFNNAQSWFNGKEFSKEFIQNAFKSSIISGENINENLLKISIPISKTTSEPQIEFFNQYKKSISFSEDKILQNDMKCILHISGLWISNHHIGLCINVLQLKVYSQKLKLTTYCIEDSDISEVEEDESDIPSDIE